MRRINNDEEVNELVENEAVEPITKGRYRGRIGMSDELRSYLNDFYGSVDCVEEKDGETDDKQPKVKRNVSPFYRFNKNNLANDFVSNLLDMIFPDE